MALEHLLDLIEGGRAFAKILNNGLQRDRSCTNHFFGKAQKTACAETLCAGGSLFSSNLMPEGETKCQAAFCGILFLRRRTGRETGSQVAAAGLLCAGCGAEARCCVWACAGLRTWEAGSMPCLFEHPTALNPAVVDHDNAGKPVFKTDKFILMQKPQIRNATTATSAMVRKMNAIVITVTSLMSAERLFLTAPIITAFSRLSRQMFGLF